MSQPLVTRAISLLQNILIGVQRIGQITAPLVYWLSSRKNSTTPWIALKKLNLLFQLARLPHIIRMVYSNKPALSEIKYRLIQSIRRADICFISECPNPRITIRLNDLPRVIGGGVIPNNKLEINKCLRQNTVNRFTQKFSMIKRCQYYRNNWKGPFHFKSF